MNNYDPPTKLLMGWLGSYGSHYAYDVKEQLKITEDAEGDLQEYVFDIWNGEDSLRHILSVEDLREVEWDGVYEWLIEA